MSEVKPKGEICAECGISFTPKKSAKYLVPTCDKCITKSLDLLTEPKANVKFIGRDSAYEGKYNYLKDCLVNDEIAQLENISARLKKDGHKYLVINTTGGEFIWTVK
jgi:hypothetical protein